MLLLNLSSSYIESAEYSDNQTHGFADEPKFWDKFHKLNAFCGVFALLLTICIIIVDHYKSQIVGKAFFIIIVILLTIVLTSTIIFIFKIPYCRGVFAVSAIILNDKNELFLIKDRRNNCWKQPGCYYKTNGFHWRTELETPYEFIKRIIEEETGIYHNDIMDIPYYDEYQGRKLKDILNGSYYIGDYGDNTPSPPPVLIMRETRMSGKRIGASRESFHIDLFYAFKITSQIETTDSKCFMSPIQIRSFNGNIYRDLAFVGQIIIDKYMKS